jgi:hypothetical protein
MNSHILAVALALTAMTAAPASAEKASDFAGSWVGAYRQGDTETPFRLQVDGSGQCVGQITEVVPEGPRRAEFTCAVRRQGKTLTLQLAKTYDGTGGWSHRVDYFGVFSPSRDTVGGVWNLDGASDSFWMRQRPDYLS